MNKQILAPTYIQLHLKPESKDAAIERVGNLLVQGGYVQPDYIQGMKAREAEFTTYIGNGIAIPHAINEYKKDIINTGIVIAQYPDGVDFGAGNVAYLVIGIAGKNDEHLEILSKIALTIQDDANVQKMRHATDTEEILATIEEGIM
ncbi:PTS sugar transporter subunit IIA [Ethanoligenens harbinense]|uniref:Mannitol-specific phosphotransferase enzyme IIA component n=1 Tax=Ethanoligenens harbinense (strain DSM 18485 / JCM 12961 / CGMCC 1.5033 / YUAN-3) TaxID=663278 RepID=E6U8C9_ETHHY|nr:PTS sugar transporter subunit IIA [Ethanoligenens harbinense]ADU28248.1 phosphoenolpyruvate-dependent sugar phosphotransferase system EIIA 2 [Ethanoligenens harbinense YUAN-3]AVQ97243.1 PTS mannitol transporter subunit IIA [Ethanoligenens harbinense YUAN-3]AYF39908.1 PTS mannitol transporter subunit IIA [Ethanoligenens harbinense]AYF42738.1 PTS mannitol transporter subunit IIA [Ethanoligenens harbinense]QCN93488.1 PTS mannitol transporter subunit IIA [Ethanoligenens harbinense]